MKILLAAALISSGLFAEDFESFLKILSNLLKTTSNMELKYFKRSEFNCKCGCNTNYIDSDFLEMMDKARRIAE